MTAPDPAPPSTAWERWLADAGSATVAPRILTALRVVVCALVLLAPESQQALRIAASPDRLRFAPEGLDLVADILPTSLPALRGLVAVDSVALVLGMLGWYARPALAVAALTTFLVWQIPQRTGAVLHDMHLVWLLALLAAVPPTAFASRGSAGSTAATWPVAVARVLLGLVYFFPGLHKALSGVSWWSGETLVLQAHYKWLVHGLPPAALRFDTWAHGPPVLASLAVVFELGFVAAILHRRTRTLALVVGLGFHAFNQILLHIPFASLWMLYVLLLPDRLFDGPSPVPAPRGSTRPVQLVALALALPIVLAGLRGQTQAWPFACYPTFAERPPPSIPDLVIRRESPRGIEESPLYPDDRVATRDDGTWAEIFRLTGAYGPVPRRSLEATMRRAWPAPNGDTDECWLVADRVTRSTDPIRRGAVLARRELLRVRCGAPLHDD